VTGASEPSLQLNFAKHQSEMSICFSANTATLWKRKSLKANIWKIRIMSYNFKPAMEKKFWQSKMIKFTYSNSGKIEDTGSKTKAAGRPHRLAIPN
jgi:hypothetical protein